MRSEILEALRQLLDEARQLSHDHHADLCGRFILLSLQLRHGPGWLSSRTPENRLSKSLPKGRWHLLGLTERQRERLRGCETLLDVLRNFQLKGVAQDSRLGLVGWLGGRFPVDLRFDVPTPEEMLAHQCAGRRFATLRLAEDLLFQPIGRHAGTLEFLLHDLEHAQKFFGQEDLRRGQIAFFQKLKQAKDHGVFAKLLENPRFSADFNYLISDMNSHPLHLWKYLKAIVMTAHKDSGSDVNSLKIQDQLLNLWSAPRDVRDAASRINYPEDETDRDRRTVSRFFMDMPDSKESYVL